MTTGQKTKRLQQTVLLALSMAALAVTFVLSGCAEPAGSGVGVSIPIVNITCTTTRCKSGAPARAFLTYTTSGCTAPAFGEKVAGSTSLSCNVTGCSGSITSFSDSSGSSANTIPSGFYDICVTLDFNSNYIGSAVPGEDATGSRTSVSVSGATLSQSVTSFTDL